MNNTTIGIIGLGFVGNAVYKSLEGMWPFVELALIDPAKGHNYTIEEIKDFDAVFVCVPSPQGPDGTANTDILENVLKELARVDFKGVIISKVTAPPNVYQRLQKSHPNLVHAPEFLTAANAERDYMLSKFAIIGGSVTAYLYEAERIIKLSQTSLTEIRRCSIQEAALTKYSINSFLATKVTFMNELATLANSLDCDWEILRGLIALDNRIGKSHMQVPGPDGEFGFGGMCFPKDTSALLKCAEQVGENLSVLDTAVKTNLVIRLTEPK
jgi:UDPglucose 6-dehydrogenase